MDVASGLTVGRRNEHLQRRLVHADTARAGEGTRSPWCFFFLRGGRIARQSALAGSMQRSSALACAPSGGWCATLAIGEGVGDRDIQ